MEAETEDEQMEMDKIDGDHFKDQALEALKEIGLPEDEAEREFEDMFGY